MEMPNGTTIFDKQTGFNKVEPQNVADFQEVVELDTGLSVEAGCARRLMVTCMIASALENTNQCGCLVDAITHTREDHTLTTKCGPPNKFIQNLKKNSC